MIRYRIHGPNDEERADSLRSDVWPDDHLRALGRLVELSARIEFHARTLLRLALNVPSDVADALFLGARMGQLSRAAKGVFEAESAPVWAGPAREWLTRAQKAVDRRDAIVHRPPAEISDGNTWLPAMAPARPTQKTDLVTEVLPLVQELVELEIQAGILIGGVMGPPGGHIELGASGG